MPLFIALAVSLGSFTGYIANDKEIPQTICRATYTAIYNSIAEAQEWRDMEKRLEVDDAYLESLR